MLPRLSPESHFPSIAANGSNHLYFARKLEFDEQKTTDQPLQTDRDD